MTAFHWVHSNSNDPECPLPNIEGMGTLEDCLTEAWRQNYYERMQTADWVVSEIEPGDVCFYWVQLPGESFLEATQ